MRFACVIVVLSLCTRVYADDTGDEEIVIDPPPEQTPAAAEPSSSSGVEPMILRRLVKQKGNLVGSPNFLIGRNPISTPAGQVTVTGNALRAYAAAGFSDRLTAGAAYSMVLDDGVEGTAFTARGPLTLFGSYEVVRKGPLEIVAGGDLVIDFAGARDAMMNLTTKLSVRGGATARITVLKKVALYSGSPLAGTPQARQLSIGLYEGGRTSLSLPLGLAVQATPKVYAYVETTLAELYLVNGPKDAMGDAKHAAVVFSDITPLTLGGFYSWPKIDVGGSLAFSDLAYAEYFVFSIGARFHTGP